ncbi:MAG: hypothetical protein RI955_406 [Bacteroidota bacterium]
MSEIKIEKYNDEIEFKVVIEKFKIYVFGILSYWYVVLLSSLLLGGILFYKAYKEPPIYTATMKYSVGNVNSFPLGNLLGQFGIDGSSSAIGKAIEITTSRKILNEILFNKIVIEGKSDYLANHIITEYNLNDDWGKLNDVHLKEVLSNFKFKHGDITKFSSDELYALKDVCSIIYSSERKGGLLVSDFESQTMVCRIQTSSSNEQISYYITKFIYDRLVDKYFSKNANPLKKSFDSFKFRTDSIFDLIKATEIRLANFKDKHHNLISQEAMVEKSMIEKEIMKLSIAYSETAKNQEMLDLSLKSVSGSIELIDEPFFPLPVEKSSKIMAFLIGGLMGGFLSVMVLLFLIFYRRIMQS